MPSCDCRLIEQLEENTDRAHAATRSLRRNLRHHMENDGLLRIVRFCFRDG